MVTTFSLQELLSELTNVETNSNLSRNDALTWFEEA